MHKLLGRRYRLLLRVMHTRTLGFPRSFLHRRDLCSKKTCAWEEYENKWMVKRWLVRVNGLERGDD
jgi:hypothetical protein